MSRAAAPPKRPPPPPPSDIRAGLAHLDSLAHRDHQTGFWLDVKPRRRRWRAVRWLATLILYGLAFCAIGGIAFAIWGLQQW